MKILVTGANGFIGRELCTHLRARGFEVVAVVRQPTDEPGEVVCESDGSWSLALAGCDTVVHLAGRAHVTHDQEPDPLQTFRASNVAPTLLLAQRAVSAGVRRLVFMSSIKVLGETTAPGCRFKPDDLPSPQDAYAASKWEAEQQLAQHAAHTGLEVVVIRPPLVYGPGVKGNFASLIRWVTRATPLPLGAVRNSRSLIGLSNLVEFTTLCADINASPNAAGEVFLVSDGEDISTTELLRRVATAYGHSSRLLPVPAWLLRGAARLVGRSAQADRLLGSLLIDDSKAREVLGWTPPVNIDEQLRRMAAGPAAANARLSTPAASRTGAGVIGAGRTSPNG